MAATFLMPYERILPGSVSQVQGSLSASCARELRQVTGTQAIAHAGGLDLGVIGVGFG
jgi:hypothetical protein